MSLPQVTGQSRRHYDIRGVLGKGGMGAVYDAVLRDDNGVVQRVAIKVVRGDAEEAEDYSRRLRDEARLLGHITHRGVVKVLGLVRVGEHPGVVLEHVDGCDLKALLERGPMPLRPALELGRHAAEALGAAHAACDQQTGEPLNIVHRDVKPANIMVSPGGEVRVLDFGVATARFADREARTATDAFGGTRNYFAPERVLDRIDEPRGDVFSLGLVMIEAITGESFGTPAFREDRHARMVQEALAHIPEQPEQLRQLLGAMLAFSPDGRPSATVAAQWFRWMAEQYPEPWLETWAASAVPAAMTPPPADAPLPSDPVHEFPATDEPPAARPPPGGSSQPTLASVADPDDGSPGARRWTWVVLGAVAALGFFGVTIAAVVAMVMARPDPTPEPPATVEVEEPALEVAPEAEPVAEPQPPPAPAPRSPSKTVAPRAPTTGTVSVQGDATLRDASGALHSSVAVPAGGYTATVVFPDAREILVDVTVSAGQTVKLTCDATAQRCLQVTTGP